MSEASANFFACTDYRAALKSRADAWKKAVPTATFQTLAKACQVQKAYLSRVLQQRADLNQDQMFLACEHLGISHLERDFLLHLHDYCRSGVEQRRKQLAAKLDHFRTLARETLGYVSVQPLTKDDDAALTGLFLSPETQIVLSHLMIERHRRHPAGLASVLGIPPARLEQLIESLRQMNLITAEADGLRVTRPYLHLAKDSPLFAPYRALLRQHVTADQMRRSDRAGYSFSLLFTASKSVEESMRQRILHILQEFEADVRAAPDEEVFYLGIDLWAHGN